VIQLLEHTLKRGCRNATFCVMNAITVSQCLINRNSPNFIFIIFIMGIECDPIVIAYPQKGVPHCYVLCNVRDGCISVFNEQEFTKFHFYNLHYGDRA
jgi:hypothetical protein